MHRTFKVPAHTIVKPMMGLSFSASKSKSPNSIRKRSSEAVGPDIKRRVCACFCISLRGRAVHCAALVRKKKVRFFSLVQDTHKEINWGFL